MVAFGRQAVAADVEKKSIGEIAFGVEMNSGGECVGPAVFATCKNHEGCAEIMLCRYVIGYILADGCYHLLFRYAVFGKSELFNSIYVVLRK